MASRAVPSSRGFIGTGMGNPAHFYYFAYSFPGDSTAGRQDLFPGRRAGIPGEDRGLRAGPPSGRDMVYTGAGFAIISLPFHGIAGNCARIRRLKRNPHRVAGQDILRQNVPGVPPVPPGDTDADTEPEEYFILSADLADSAPVTR